MAGLLLLNALCIDLWGHRQQRHQLVQVCYWTNRHAATFGDDCAQPVPLVTLWSGSRHISTHGAVATAG